MFLSAVKSVFFVFYLWVVVMVVIYGLHRYVLVMLYWRHRRSAGEPDKRLDPLPPVTIQLPVYNEMFVVRRLIEAACRIRYPSELLEIQVLDDSTDETADIVRTCVQDMRSRGLDIRLIHREDRTGYKAGALQVGLKEARGEFIALFDADFIPAPEFLERTIHHFAEPSVGMVQVRWGHMNEDQSLLTKGQAIFLDGHFVVEHLARSRSGRFINFNGTAGIWRRRAIESSGEWEHDTLTEDLDLSYRAQLGGWKFVYLPEVVCPAELPAEMNAFKGQQHRWTKGAVQTAKKILPKVLASDLPWWVKLEAVFHLTCSTVYVYVFLMTLALWPAIVCRFESNVWSGWYGVLAIDVPLFVLASLSASVFYVVAQRGVKRTWWKTLAYLPFLMCLGIGLSLVNAKGVAEGLLGHRSAFERTPKYGGGREEVRARMAKYRGKVTYLPFLELALACYVAWTIWWAFTLGYYSSIPFLLLFALGYLYVGVLSLAHSSRWAGRAATHAT
ncbi:MAG: cellulose synthase family protein [Planctomycetota bacterium]